jgi:MFS family permease
MTYRSKVAVVYLLGFFLDLINMFIASVAFPAMAHAFNATPSALAWVSNGYIAGLTLVIPFSSVLTRRIGPKRVILLSLFLFSAACCGGLVCHAGKPDCLASVAGVGGGLLIPVGQALTWQQFKPHERPDSPQRSCWSHCLPPPAPRYRRRAGADAKLAMDIFRHAPGCYRDLCSGLPVA